MEILPIPTTPDTNFSVRIESVLYDFRLTWQARNWSWYITISLGNTVLVRNAKLAIYTPLFRNNREFAPSGNLYVTKNNNNPDTTAGRWNLGSFSKDFSLVYFTAEEISP
jgi:hypothetical protein